MLVSKKELANLKLRSIKSDDLRELAASFGLPTKGNVSDLIKRLVDVPQDKIDEFIKRKYRKLIEKRQGLISDDDLKRELLKVKGFRWGVVQGQLDQKIQAELCKEICKIRGIITRS